MLIGLTGRSGSGKSTVSAAFRENGYFVIDADKVSRAVSDTKKAEAVLRAAFGDNIYDGGVLNRKKLGSIVFSDKTELEKLNRVLLPLICDEIENMIKESKNDFVLLDAPTLFESGIYSKCDIIIAVTAPMKMLIKRIMKRDDLTKAEAEKRISSQLSDIFFRDNCNIIIENDSTYETLKKKAHNIAVMLKERNS